jgi:hypothetical protein
LAVVCVVFAMSLASSLLTLMEGPCIKGKLATLVTSHCECVHLGFRAWRVPAAV